MNLRPDVSARMGVGVALASPLVLLIGLPVVVTFLEWAWRVPMVVLETIVSGRAREIH